MLVGSHRELDKGNKLSASSLNTEVKRTFCTVKIVHAYVRILVAQIRKLTVSLKNGSGEVGLSTHPLDE